MTEREYCAALFLASREGESSRRRGLLRFVAAPISGAIALSGVFEAVTGKDAATSLMVAAFGAIALVASVMEARTDPSFEIVERTFEERGRNLKIARVEWARFVIAGRRSANYFLDAFTEDGVKWRLEEPFFRAYPDAAEGFANKPVRLGEKAPGMVGRTPVRGQPRTKRDVRGLPSDGDERLRRREGGGNPVACGNGKILTEAGRKARFRACCGKGAPRRRRVAGRNRPRKQNGRTPTRKPREEKENRGRTGR